MTPDQLRQWLATAIAAPADQARARMLLAQAEAGHAGALRAIQDLKTREVVRIAKYDKTTVTTPGVEGLTPVETVEVTFEEGRLIRSEVRGA